MKCEPTSRWAARRATSSTRVPSTSHMRRMPRRTTATLYISHCSRLASVSSSPTTPSSSPPTTGASVSPAAPWSSTSAALTLSSPSPRCSSTTFSYQLHRFACEFFSVSPRHQSDFTHFRLLPFAIPGYIISFVTLIFVALCEVAWHVFSAQTAYSVNLAAVSLVAIGCTVQQSSFYGFAALLPKKKYTQALMTGESIAGFLVSINRVATKLLIHNDQVSTVIFFLTSTVYIALSYALHVITVDSPFIRYHMKACTKIVLRPDEVRQGTLAWDRKKLRKF